MSNPFKEFDTDIDGRQLKPGVFGIGDLDWNNDLQSWCGLVNYHGSLCTAEFRVTAERL